VFAASRKTGDAKNNAFPVSMFRISLMVFRALAVEQSRIAKPSVIAFVLMPKNPATTHT
jgi:hypothetical protein